MLITIKRQIFDSLDDSALPWACIEPVIQQVRGKNFESKSRIYKQLTAGQRALLMFQVLYGHTQNGAAEFYDHTSYFIAEPGIWGQFKDGMKYFEEGAMIQLIEEMEGIYKTFNGENRQDVMGDLGNDLDFSTYVNQVDAKLHEILPATLKRVGAFIRNNPVEFVQIEE